MLNFFIGSIEFICYDDGCHLKRFAQNPIRSNITSTAKKISDTNIVIDKFHFPGHTDKWCQSNCNPNDFEELNGVSDYVMLYYNNFTVKF